MNFNEDIEYDYLNLKNIGKIKTDDPLEKLCQDQAFFRDSPEMAIVELMKSPNYIPLACKYLLNVDIIPFYHVVLRELWMRPFPMLIGTRGLGKSFILAVYALLKLMLHPNYRIVITGAGFRQSRIIFNYMENIYYNSKIFKAICPFGNKSGPKRDVDQYVFYCGDSVAHAIPVGDGGKIRGLRANTNIVDEFSVIPLDIYETIIQGFTSTISNPVQAHKEQLRRERLLQNNIEIPQDLIQSFGNQTILSGTAYYEFNHLCDYFKQYKEIIESKGDVSKIKEIFKGEIPDNFNWRDYSIMRIPYDVVPKGFLDPRMISRAKATVHIGIFQMEYGAVFSRDSAGFFKRSLIESCVAHEKNKIVIDNELITFSALTRGNPNNRYVYGIDPASESDNFSIVILELQPNHRRIVYCWTTNRKKYMQSLKDGVTKIEDYYSFCVRKIRSLMRVFPCERMIIDPGGGGIAIAEGLRNVGNMSEFDKPIWPVINPDKEQETDFQPGLHILEMFNFTNADIVSSANHDLRKDMEDKVLLFPYFDTISIELAMHEDKSFNRVYDTLEDCINEIEDLKNELSTIIVTRTPNSHRERFSTPDVKMSGIGKGRMNKDRYSSLLMANYIARIYQNPLLRPAYETHGALVGNNGGESISGKIYKDGPEWVNNFDWAVHNETCINLEGRRKIFY